MRGISAFQVTCVFKDEWRYWLRSKLAITVLAIGSLLTFASVAMTAIYMHDLAHQRHAMQHASEQAFVEQPDRHPHRMVHYGHYAFKTPPPLSLLDPGVDAYTGNAIFLEGHRQNSATFAEQRQSTGLTKLGSLAPAFIGQVLAPLMLILIGYSMMSRERESQTLAFLVAQGTSIFTLILGKGLALGSVAGLILLPLVSAALFAVSQGESLVIAFSFVGAYGLYLGFWVLLGLLVSTLASTSRASFTLLIVAWIVLCVAMPRVASTTASAVAPSVGKLETDFAVISELRKLGDGHNANDPAFKKLKQSLLEKYKVDKVEALPINFRGVVASQSEGQLTQVLNRFAHQQMTQELQQARIARQFGWASPKVALHALSMVLSGTSLETHHRFLTETEALRFNFVQSLNQAHVEQLSYQDDINRNKGDEAWQKARVDASNWQMIRGFEFTIDNVKTRLVRGQTGLVQLTLWVLVLLVLIRWAGRKAL
jgi:ABC-2 type transport system permease protein